MYQEYATFGFGGILSMIRRRFYEDGKSDHEIAEEKQEVCTKCAEAFWRLKGLLMKTLMLKVPDMDRDFFVWTDTSKEGLGGVLTQENNYAMCYCDLLATVYAWECWDTIWLDKIQTKKIDYCGMKYFLHRITWTHDRGIGQNFLVNTILRLLT